MTLTTSLQSSLATLPLDGASVLVDAYLDELDDAAALCDVLLDAVGHKGTIVMPTFTLSRTLADTSRDPVPYHRDLAVDDYLGKVPEVFRHQAASLRTDHPTHSFAAAGNHSQVFLSTNRDNNPLGPIKKLNLSNGLSLRIGQPLRRVSALHLAEEQAMPALSMRSAAKRINIAGFEERVIVHHAPCCTRGYANIEEEVLSSTKKDYPTTTDYIHLIPLRVLVQAARNAMTSSPEAILCRREGCRSCEVRLSVLNGDD